MAILSASLPEQVAAALRAPFVPGVVRALDGAGGYLAAVWPQLQPSVETAGFLGSALYMVDMSLDAVEQVYEPVLSRASLLDGGLAAVDIERIEAVLDVFHWLQPQLLLLLAALAEAWKRPRVGGEGRPEPRQGSERERAHLAAKVELAPAHAGLLPEIVRALQLEAAPDLYRAVAGWPRYLEAAWDELQHLSAYPPFRQRGRALYYYARSSSRFLARPLEASRNGLRERGLSDADLDAAGAAIDGMLPTMATMMMHCTAMRVGLGITEREVVGQR
jgi:hypothetical protein